MKRVMALALIAAALLTLAAAPAAAQGPSYREALPGKVLEVRDGDTLTVEIKTASCGRVIRKIRLGDGVDAPEYSQPFGTQARLRAQALTQGREVTAELTGGHTHNRLVGRIWLPDGRRLGAVLVEEGLAWVDPRYAHRSEGQDMLRRQERAREDKKGLWGAESPIAPWDWRKGKR